MHVDQYRNNRIPFPAIGLRKTAVTTPLHVPLADLRQVVPRKMEQYMEPRWYV